MSGKRNAAFRKNSMRLLLIALLIAFSRKDKVSFGTGKGQRTKRSSPGKPSYKSDGWGHSDWESL